MSLKQSIVIKSRFSVPLGNGKGSRGGTPGEYVKRYMARNTAIENIAPTRLDDMQGAFARYDERELASEEEDSIPSMKRRMKKAQKKGGIAFGDDDVALSDKKLNDISQAIQEQFNRGKTAIETIMSFDEEYLRENGCLDPDFVHEERGDFAGHIDQLKLRKAIMNGISRLNRHFDDLHYVGVIQVDTNHVHCHILLMDFGEGQKASDGMQRGKLTAREMRMMRHGVDLFLDAKQRVRVMSSSVMHDKRNAVCYIKKFTHKTLDEQGLPQFLISCLPDNRNHWSANSNRKDMRKANAIVRDFVLDILQPDGQNASPMYRKAHESIVSYADARQEREGISDEERMKLIRNGEETLIRSCMNGVYATLKEIPKSQLTVRTPMLEAMSMDYEEMASQAVNDPMMEFGFRLRSYSNRLHYHRKEYHRFRNEAKAYDDAEDKSEASKALGDYLAFERDYQRMLMVKYLHFLSFVPPDENIKLEFDNIMHMKDRVETIEGMADDEMFQVLNEEEADAYGLREYGIGRGSYIKKLPDIWQRRVEHSKEQYDAAVADFRSKLQDFGLDFDGKGVTRDKPYTFDEVKALDIHHLGYDFPYDVRMSKKNADLFIKFAKERSQKLEGAVSYLKNTDQADKVSELPIQDVASMRSFAATIEGAMPELKSSRKAISGKHNGTTIRLGRDYGADMKIAVKNALESSFDFTE